MVIDNIQKLGKENMQWTCKGCTIAS